MPTVKKETVNTVTLHLVFPEWEVANWVEKLVLDQIEKSAEGEAFSKDSPLTVEFKIKQKTQSIAGHESPIDKWVIIADVKQDKDVLIKPILKYAAEDRIEYEDKPDGK